MIRRDRNMTVVVVSRILFMLFAFAYLYFFQGELLGAAHAYLSQGRTADYNCLISCLVITFLSLLLEYGVEKTIGFKGYVYACNYIPSAFLLGFMTRFDGNALLGNRVAPVVLFACFSVLVMVCCKAIQTGIMTEKREPSASVASNLFIITLAIASIPVLGNCDENWHRALRMEHYLAMGRPEDALEVGCDESESDRSMDLLRAKALLMLDTDTLSIGNVLADRLFEFSVAERLVLASELRHIEESDTVNESANLTLTSYLLEKHLDRFVSEFDVYSWPDGDMPTYFIQALVMADSLGMAMPDMSYVESQNGYADAVSQYTQFAEQMRIVQDEPVRIRANSLFLDFHKTYFWFYRFAR